MSEAGSPFGPRNAEPGRPTGSHRQILRSSAILGGASVVNVIIGLARNKAPALLLAPAGVGIIGLLQNIVTTASTVASLGLGNAATRQVAEAAAEESAPRQWPLRRALFRAPRWTGR